jgi:hypothetical protein
MHRRSIPNLLMAMILLVAANSAGNVWAEDGHHPNSGERSLQPNVFFVATDGDDEHGDGSIAAPWATITHALDSVADGSTILVRPGEYVGQVRLRGKFSQGVTVRSEVPYGARLRNDGTTVTCFYGRGITLEGFDIAHSGPGAGALVIQIQDLLESDTVGRITLRDNVLHDSFNNDILKINNGATEVLVEGNMFYNQAGSDEHIDVNSVTDVVIQDNVFFNDFAGSRRDDGDTSSFIVIKDSNGDSDNQLGSERITVRRNVFAHWEGSSGQGYVRVGEDGTDYFEARNVLIENNLMIGNNTQQIRSPFQMMGVYSVTVRANTVAGDMPAKEFGARIFTFGANPANDQIHLYNNVWSDPTGTMGDTFSRGGNTSNLSFDNNLFWNAGVPFPTSSESIIEVHDDVHRVVADPLLGNQSGLVLPRWEPAAGGFLDGSATIREAFERLATQYGAPAADSPVIDAADPDNAPSEDILGNVRNVGTRPDIGAFEYQGYGFTLFPMPATRSIQPGESTTFSVHVQPVGSFSSPVGLVHSPPAMGLDVKLEPSNVVPGAAATLTMTDTHNSTWIPAVVHRVTITGTAAGAFSTAAVHVLVGGERCYLPVFATTDVLGSVPLLDRRYLISK